MKKTIYTDEYRALIDWLRATRKKKGLTQRDLASILDWDNCAIGRIETMQRRLDIVEFIDVCKALDCDPIAGLKLIL